MYNNSQAVGVYTPNTQMSFDKNKLLGLGFSQAEIATLLHIVMLGGAITPSVLTSFGMDYESAKKFKYMYDIATGKTIVESTDDIVKHLRKIYGQHRRIGINDLALSKINKIPRMAVVAGIKDNTFSIYNSSQYPANERMYEVDDISNGRISIISKRKPVLKYGQSKKIDDILEIKEVRQDGNVVVAIDKKYCRLVNRFVVVGSLRRPEFHSGLIEIICIEGTKVYIYVQTSGTGENVRYRDTQRVYDYGFMPNEIQPKLIKVASEIYPKICGVYAATHPANCDFKIITEEEKKEEIEIEE